MIYYNPNTKEEKSFNNICKLYNSSFPINIENINNEWFKLYTQDKPQPENNYKIEPGEIKLIDGKYTKTWNKIPLTDEEKQSLYYTKSEEIIKNQNNIYNNIQEKQYSPSEYAMFVKAGLYPEWNFNIEYKKGQRIVFDDILYEVQKDVISIEEFPPIKDIKQTTYRPLFTDIENPEYPNNTLDELKQNKIIQIDKETSDSIFAGFNYKINNQEYHFSYDALDQQNFADTANMCQLAISGAEGLPTSVTWNSYLSDGTLVQQVFDAQSFLNLYTRGAMVHKATKMAVGGQRKAAVQAAQSEEELNMI